MRIYVVIIQRFSVPQRNIQHSTSLNQLLREFYKYLKSKNVKLEYRSNALPCMRPGTKTKMLGNLDQDRRYGLINRLILNRGVDSYYSNR